MKHLVSYISSNRPGLSDASGAFIPEARRYCDHWGVETDTIYSLDCSRVKGSTVKRFRFGTYCESLADAGIQCDSFAYFGHGTYYSIQLGYQRQHVGELAAALALVLKKRCKIILYACSTAENDEKDHKIEEMGAATDGGFADRLRGALMSHGIEPEVYGHKTPGHVTWNPYMCRFDPDCASIGGDWIIKPRTEYWGVWCKAMRESELRFEFPWYSQQVLYEWLRDYADPGFDS